MLENTTKVKVKCWGITQHGSLSGISKRGEREPLNQNIN